MFEDLVKSIKQERRERGSKLKGGLKRKPAEEEPSTDDDEQDDDTKSEDEPEVKEPEVNEPEATEDPPENNDAEETDEPEAEPTEASDEEPAADEEADAEDEAELGDKGGEARAAIKDILSKPPIDASKPDETDQATDQAAQPESPEAPQPGGQPGAPPAPPSPKDIPAIPSVKRAEVLDRNYGIPKRKKSGEDDDAEPKSEDGLMPNAGVFANSEKAKRLWAARMERLDRLKRETASSLDIAMGTSRRGARWPLRRGPLGSYPSVPPS